MVEWLCGQTQNSNLKSAQAKTSKLNNKQTKHVNHLQITPHIFVCVCNNGVTVSLKQLFLHFYNTKR